MEAQAVYERFVAACQSGDADTAKALSTEEAWRGSGDSVRRFVEQATGARIVVTPSGALRQHEDRATLPAFLGTGAADNQHIWFLLRRVGDNWRVDGFADAWSIAGLYVNGQTERPPAFSELPSSEPAAQWFAALRDGHDLTADGDAGETALALIQELAASAESIRLVRTVGIASAHRYGAAVAFEQADGLSQTVWALLQSDEQGGLISVVDRSFSASISQLLRGVDPPWPPVDARKTAPQYTATEATDLFQQALQSAHEERSAATGADSPLGGRMGQVLTELFETLLDPEDRPNAAADGPGGAEVRLAHTLRAAVQDFVESDAVDSERTATDLHIDSTFVRESGSELVSSLVGALTGALIPSDLKLELPAEEGEESARVRIDLGDLLSGLFTPTPKDTE